MKRSDAFPSKYIGKDDIGEDPNAELILTIANVRFEAIKDNHGVEEDKPVMHFQERGSKPMILNSVNWQMIEKSYGPESDEWGGKRIALYVDPNIIFGGKVVGGVRVRPPAGAPIRTAQSVSRSAPPVDILTLDQAVAKIEAIGLTKDDLIGYLKANDRKAYNGARDTELVLNYIAANSKQNPTDPIGEDIPF